MPPPREKPLLHYTLVELACSHQELVPGDGNDLYLGKVVECWICPVTVASGGEARKRPVVGMKQLRLTRAPDHWTDWH